MCTEFRDTRGNHCGGLINVYYTLFGPLIRPEDEDKDPIDVYNHWKKSSLRISYYLFIVIVALLTIYNFARIISPPPEDANTIRIDIPVYVCIDSDVCTDANTPITIKLLNSRYDDVEKVNTFTQYVGVLAMSTGVFVAHRTLSDRPGFSRKFLALAFMFQFLCKIVVAVLPYAYIASDIKFNIDSMWWRTFVDYNGIGQTVEQWVLQGLDLMVKKELTIGVTKFILPDAFGILLGLSSGAILVREMFPGFYWFGWVVKTMAPIIAPLIVVIGAAAIQLLGDYKMSLCITFLCMASFVPFAVGSRATAPHYNPRSLRKAMRGILYIQLAFVALAGGFGVWWYATSGKSESSGDELDLPSVIMIVIMFIANRALAGVVYCDYLVESYKDSGETSMKMIELV